MLDYNIQKLIRCAMLFQRDLKILSSRAHQKKNGVDKKKERKKFSFSTL